MERQGFGIRLGALIIDVLILIVLDFIIGQIFPRPVGVLRPVGGAAFIIFSNLFHLGYTSTEIFKAASPGKMILGLKIGSETGSPATQNQLITRWAIKNSFSLLSILTIIPILGFIFGLLAFLAGVAVFVGCFLALGAQRQALHDIIAHTAVYRTAPVVIGAPSIAVPPPPPPMG